MATRQEVADHLNLSLRTVAARLSAGIFPNARGRGGLDLDLCRQAELAYLRADLVRSETDLDPRQEQARLNHHRANLAALEEAHRRGELIEIESAAETFGAECANIRARLLSLPHKAAPELAVETDTAKMFTLLQEHITDALRELSSDEYFQRRSQEYEARKAVTA